MSFSLSLKKATERMSGDLDQITRSVTTQVASSLVKRSPVDTGRFRGNWVFGVGAVDNSVTDDVDVSGGKTLIKLTAEINKSKGGGITYLSNSLPYARRLEYGHSNQAPEGLVRITVAEFQRYVDSAVKAVK